MQPMVMLQQVGDKRHRVLVSQVEKIISSRIIRGEEQFLVQWKTEQNITTPPLSWHRIEELVRCLDEVQTYIDRVAARPVQHQILTKNLKRKSPEDADVGERRPSPFERQRSPVTPAAPESLTIASNGHVKGREVPAYTHNGVVDTDKNGFLFCRPLSNSSISRMDIRDVSPPSLPEKEFRDTVRRALTYIRAEYVRRLNKLPGPRIVLNNFVDTATPSLRFKFIESYKLTQGVYRMPQDTQQGCMKCSPQMGRNIGCEYTKKCECLEYAAVDEARITDPIMMAEYRKTIAEGGSTEGFPKKFPYFAEGTKRQKEGCLVPFYLNSRRPIYECNENCNCGPNCRNKNVQFGRKVELEIFRTRGGRGWGLRCLEDLHEGQFIDTYRGEIITDAEATRREESASKAKSSYLYTLDKFAESEGIPEEDLYVVDGEFMGGPTKFMNHSCEPNCRQYTVSYNKNDPKVYDIAFFASRFIPKNEELTFDYLDKEDGEPMEQPGEDAVPCLCGSAKCRKWLWT